MSLSIESFSRFVLVNKVEITHQFTDSPKVDMSHNFSSCSSPHETFAFEAVFTPISLNKKSYLRKTKSHGSSASHARIPVLSPFKSLLSGDFGRKKCRDPKYVLFFWPT